MIEQRINLYQDRFHEKRVWISAAQLGLALLLLSVIISASSLFLQSDLETVTRQNQLAREERDRLAADLVATNAEFARLREDTRLDDQIGATSRQISARREVLNFVDANRFGSGKGFSDYLVALSNLHLEGLWLDHIRFAENYVQIKGSSLTAEVVPVYFDRFSEEPAFQGNRFDLFQLSRARNSEWKIDFEIATSETFDD